VASRVEAELERQVGLPGSVGVGGNKLVSRVASHFLANGGVCDVLRGTERGFLEPLPLDLLPGLGVVRRRVLGDWGVVRIGELAALPRSHLVTVFGAFGATLQLRAAGEDWEPVLPPTVRPAVEEGAALPRDSADPEELSFHLRRLAERACFRLRAADKVAGCVEVRVRYADGRTARRTGRLAPPTSWDHEVLPTVRRLLAAAFVRRVRVRGLGVGLSRLSVQALQLDLFRSKPSDLRREALCLAVDTVRRRHGFDSVAWGAAARSGET
jgi:DNA polymerase-4